MNECNKKSGSEFEREYCSYLCERGFWVLNIGQNQAGQPADILAARNGRAYLIDCKVCENDRFAFSRIEPNQLTAMTFWNQCGNGVGLFALKLSDSNIYMLSAETMASLSEDKASIGRDLIKTYGVPVGRWAKNCR